MKIDTSRTVEIAYSPVKLIAFIGLAIALTAGAAVLAFHWDSDIPPRYEFIGYFNAFVACFAMLLSGYAAGTLIWRLAAIRGPVVTITPEGIRDIRVAREVIPWRAVHSIDYWKPHKAMVLTIDPAVETSLSLTRAARWSRGPNRFFGVDGLCISARELKMSYIELLATSLAYREAANGEPMQAWKGLISPRSHAG
ncbi:MAG: hypothetical protein EOR25_29730 [Mesorhizobium sp.]|uniref:STM3941 family protein n=1 Tax=Mesorhizobium sp. TaxID=1871066 RepID=UPI000FE36658|nr:STM3941 family protein [Mesorhizobium sp.]RWJ04841.1 MAG: hypothetical protein EOR24_29625 [Mesorhizobium sp.]RWJ12007.1 MAG: hypothetical protein EOR25_29730 [Mesorhizobium sp.]